MKDIIVGYGNVDRQDDGVAWHVRAEMLRMCGRPAPASPDDEFPEDDQNPAVLFALQLTPELAETLSLYERACFVDAHTGRVQAEVNEEVIQPEYQTSPLTHHMTPQSCLALAQSLYGHAPHSILVSVRGYEFGFSHELSESTERLAKQAAERIVEWLKG